ncbi:hypothetical protein [Thaumasiovibrio subtropicus]|uniref:hypothetical protein n=1 Tax=Thaumasiovibrio subtropicus TaxID=1891207 RepID=UPI000B35FD1B|nr:hypothetical protein [Thaumasiovibrio subtropicus]
MKQLLLGVLMSVCAVNTAFAFGSADDITRADCRGEACDVVYFESFIGCTYVSVGRDSKTVELTGRYEIIHSSTSSTSGGIAHTLIPGEKAEMLDAPGTKTDFSDFYCLDSNELIELKAVY